MAFFPKCTFELALGGARVAAGARNQGFIKLDAPEAIERAENVQLQMHCRATAGYGSGKNRRVVERSLMVLPFKIDLPSGVLAAGRHQIPFVFDAPPWLPANFMGNDCSIRMHAELRLDVDWAFDPTATFLVPVQPLGGVYQRKPLPIRSPVGFHKSVVLEISLESNVVLQGEPIRGQVALRSGAADIEDLVLTAGNSARIIMSSNDVRSTSGSSLRIGKRDLQTGRSIPFVFPTDNLVPASQNGFIDIGTYLEARLAVPWNFDPAFRIGVDVVPGTSTIHGEGAALTVGQERLSLVARAIQAATGLTPARVPPALAEGRVGIVDLCVFDAPLEGRPGIGAAFAFPDLDLGLTLRRTDLRDLLGTGSALTPESLRSRFSVGHKREQSALSEQAVGSLLTQLLRGLERVDMLHLSDHHLRFTSLFSQEDPEALVGFAKLATTHAAHISETLISQPFASDLLASESEWRRAAELEQAVLLPSRPSMTGITRSVRVATGEVRVFRATLSIRRRNGGQVATVLDIALGDVELPKNVGEQLNAASSPTTAGLTAVRAHFPSVSLAQQATEEDDHHRPQGSAHLLLEAATLIAPSVALATLDTMVAWVLGLRGERRVDAPYR